jgi:hypothetical protein
MYVEIESVELKDKVVNIYATDISEENLQRMERMRDDGFERILHFVFDTREKKSLTYLHDFLKRQKAVKEADPHTWGEALQAVQGRVTCISGRYIEYDI